MNNIKIPLDESDIPRQWYNLAADLPTQPPPPLGPDGKPIGLEMLAPVLPKLLGVEGLVPGYVFVKGWPSNSGTVVGGANPNGGTYFGCAHVIMPDYALPVQGFVTETLDQTLNFHMETVFNDGVDPRPAGGYTNSDWTHVMMGVSTDFDLGNNLTFTPGVYHQVTMEDSPTRGVSPDHNITWASLILKYKF